MGKNIQAILDFQTHISQTFPMTDERECLSLPDGQELLTQIFTESPMEDKKLTVSTISRF